MRGFVEGDLGITDWNKVGQDELNKAVNYKQNTGVAKNIIFFLGDGNAKFIIFIK